MPPVKCTLVKLTVHFIRQNIINAIKEVLIGLIVRQIFKLENTAAVGRQSEMDKTTKFDSCITSPKTKSYLTVMLCYSKLSDSFIACHLTFSMKNCEVSGDADITSQANLII